MAKKNTAPALRIRRARAGDASQLADLSGQLGYPSTPAEIAKRLRRLRPASLHAVFVAETSDSTAGRARDRLVIGWLHVSVEHLVEVGTRAEVNSLIVADGQRSLGAGAQLLKAAEEWALTHGCKSVSVRSNVVRDRAHKFYERNGYEHYKTQKAFRKPL
ncbi:MAG TPA: GNAT family N-acetyltransferase [Candidatus Acidoferrum sp.]|jgi:GNAT superfamily N-acetyltransferase